MSLNEKVTNIIVDKLSVEESRVVPEASFLDDLGADSLDTVELIMEFEEEFDLEIPDEDAEKITTVGAALEYINNHANNFEKRVVITGEGSISPLGHNSQSLWENLVKGKSGIDHISSFDTENFSIKIAGEVKDFDPNNLFEAKEARKLDRFTMFGLIAAEQALQNSNYKSSDAGVIVGTGVGGMHTLEEEHQKLIKKGQRGVSPFYVPKMIPNIAGGQIAIKHNLHGLNFSMSTACSSATDAIGMAYRLISNGYSKAILCGGAEGSITPLTLSGFANMKALSKNNENPQGASKPFDKDRDGFIL